MAERAEAFAERALAAGERDALALSQAAREACRKMGAGFQGLREQVRGLAHVDFDHGVHAGIRGFGQQVGLGVDPHGLKEDAKILGVTEHVGIDRGLDVHGTIGHSAAGVGLSEQGATGMVDTLGAHLEGGAGITGVTGKAGLSSQGIVVPLGLTGSEALVGPKGEVNVHARGVDAGINVVDGSGAHAGISRFGVGLGVSSEHGGTIDAHVGRHHVNDSLKP
jgi:hypothetical protein